MSAGRELFKLFGVIGMQGVEDVDKSLKKIDRQARKVQKEVDRMGRKVQDVGKVLTKAFTLPLLAAAAAATKAVDDATDLNETISKTQVLFGESEKSIRKWAQTSSTAMGQSEQQAMDAAGTFAVFGKSAGLAGDELVKFSTDMVGLSSDMASFFNTEPADAITAIGAAFRGETEPIRRYGVMLDDATMRQKALELGLVSTTKNALEPQTKVLAAQALILDQTKDAQGDFARTSAGLANQKRILSAQIKDVSATIGQLFIPVAKDTVGVLTSVLDKVKTMIQWWDELDEQTKTTLKGFALITAGIGPLSIGLGKIISMSRVFVPILTAVTAGTIGWSAAMSKLNKMASVWVATLGSLIALGWYYYSQWDTISVQLVSVWENIKSVAISVATGVVDAFGDMTIKVIDLMLKFSDLIPGMTDKLNGAKKAILLFQAAMFKATAEQNRNAVAAGEQADATDGVVESVKKAISSGKELLGLIGEQTTATKGLTQAEKERLQAAEDLAAKRLEFEKNARSELDRMVYSDIELLEFEKEEKLRQAEELGASTFEIETLYSLKKIELKEKEAEEIDRIRESNRKKEEYALQRGFSVASKLGNKLNDVLGKFSDNRITRLNNEEKRKIQAIEHSAMTQEQKEKAIQKIEADTEKERRKLERQRAVREKMAALFNIAINTASAVVEALPNIPLSVAVGLLGVAEGVAVASEPLPFFDGGLIEGTPGGVNAIVGENNQSEVVFPLERGISAIVDGLVEALGSIELPVFSQQGELAGAFGGNTVNVNIGVFSGDERSLKSLERQLEGVRISENVRKGL